jgi:ketosteroid isomerase-like protein
MSEFETAEIRRLVEQRSEAIRAKDVERSTSMTAAEYLLFDVVGPLQAKSSVAARKRTEEWFATFRGPIGYEIHDLQIVARDGVGFSHGLNHVSATKIDGTSMDRWWRATVCYQKIEGNWRITHKHNSVPFDVSNGKAYLGLTPWIKSD